MTETKKFIDSLKDNDLEALRSISKSDLHNHSTRGGNIRDFCTYTGKKVIIADSFADLNEMQKWYEVNIKPYINPIKLLELAFKQAKYDGITILHMSFGLKNIVNYKEHFDLIKDLKEKYAPECIFIPEIGFGRHQNIYDVEKLFDQILEYKFFKAIDLRGDEILSVDKFKNLYKKAKANNFILKAHLGEYRDAKSVINVVKALSLNQIQHGISIVSSKSIMDEIVKRDIQLNICPTSNIKLQRVESYESHPIRELFDNGVKVTINTDDMLIFDSSASEEYMNLYKEKLFSVEELNQIRLQGLGQDILGNKFNKNNF